MASKNKVDLKAQFLDGSFPLVEFFKDLIDSMFHITEDDPPGSEIPATVQGPLGTIQISDGLGDLAAGPVFDTANDRLDLGPGSAGAGVLVNTDIEIAKEKLSGDIFFQTDSTKSFTYDEVITELINNPGRGFYIGALAPFNGIKFRFDIPASEPMTLSVRYVNGLNSTADVVELTNTVNGFTQDGEITFDLSAMSDWEKNHPNGFDGVGNQYYWIKVTSATTPTTYPSQARISMLKPSSGKGELRLGLAGSVVTEVLDEDNLVSDRDDAIATQQSIKAYAETVRDAKPYLTGQYWISLKNPVGGGDLGVHISNGLLVGTGVIPTSVANFPELLASISYSNATAFSNTWNTSGGTFTFTTNNGSPVIKIDVAGGGGWATMTLKPGIFDTTKARWYRGLTDIFGNAFDWADGIDTSTIEIGIGSTTAGRIFTSDPGSWTAAPIGVITNGPVNDSDSIYIRYRSDDASAKYIYMEPWTNIYGHFPE
jgi:hypothetical protein